ncbi:erythromycin esterase family protein [Halorubrum coriense]|nr:erythromycin esterase family protein [Halorubrum coriense]
MEELAELRFRLIRLLVEEFGLRAVAFEAPFHQFCRIDEGVTTGTSDIRSILTGTDGYRPIQTAPVAELLEWLQSVNAERPAEDHVHVYGFDTTIIEDAAIGIEPYLNRVGADIDGSLREDLDTMKTGYESEDERQALLESARQVHSIVSPMLDANESAWVEAESRRAYERVRHRLNLIEVQIEAHELGREDRHALRDEAMAENVKWIHDRSTGPVVIWGVNAHLGRGRHVLDEWDVDVPSMGNRLADSYGDLYYPVVFKTGTRRVAAKDFTTETVEEYPIPDPPSMSIPAVFQQVAEPVFSVSVEDLYDDLSIRDWPRTQPRRHTIWGGTPDGDNPVRYTPPDLSEFDRAVFVRETSPLVHLD